VPAAAVTEARDVTDENLLRAEGMAVGASVGGLSLNASRSMPGPWSTLSGIYRYAFPVALPIWTV
jgi:hypothetical protein